MRSEYEQIGQTCQGDFLLLERRTLLHFCENELRTRFYEERSSTQFEKKQPRPAAL